MCADYRKISVERLGAKNFFTSAHISNCMKKGEALAELRQVVRVEEQFSYSHRDTR